MKKVQAKILSFLLAGVLVAASWGNTLQTHAEEEGEALVREEAISGSVSGNDEVTAPAPEAAAAEEDRELDYILGRPMTPEEEQEQKDIFNYYMSLGGGVILPEDLPVDNTLPVSMVEVRGTLPTRYDAREANLVPAIRNQNPYGICWCFSSLACMEINLIKNGLADQGVDLSEFHLAFWANYSAPDPLGNDGGAKSWYDSGLANGVHYLDRGGNQVMAANALMNWKGAVNEGLVTAAEAKAGLDTNDQDLAYGHDTYYMGSWYQIPTANPAEMKAAILEYGALGINYYADSFNYYNSSTAAEYCPVKNTGTNHAVTIVGWDDSYNRANFKTMPENDGAWLVRNSWGSWWGKEGYFWLSYEDKSIYKTAYAFEGRKSDIYDNNYQYDHATSSAYRQTASAANVYTAKGNGNKIEELKAVGIFLYEAGVEYSLQVYRNLTDPNDPASGEPMLPEPQTGTTGYAGYYMIPLNKSISLEPGDTFAIVFDFGKEPRNMAFVGFESKSENYRHSETRASAGESFYSYRSGWDWIDLGVKEDANFKIKAYTSNTDIEMVKCQGITMSCPSRVIDKNTSVQCEVSFNPANTSNKELRWSSSDPSVASVDDNGRVTGLKTGTARITATTVKGGHTADWEITVVQPVTSVNFRYDSDEYYVGDTYEAKVEIGPGDATDKSLTWTSSNSKVAQVDIKGNITIKAEGSARITAAAKSGVSKSVDIQAKEDLVRSFVQRMYTVALGRKAEAKGLAEWTGWLKEQEIDGAGIAYGFICSDEFKGRKLDNSAYVDTLYRTFFDRNADPEGKAVWMQLLAEGSSREYVLSGFVNSKEFSNLCDRFQIARGTMQEDGSSVYRSGVREFVLRLYTKALGRPGETMGVEDWTNLINTGKMTAEEVAKSFFVSDEFQNKKLSNADYVETLYQTFMNRGADAQGKADWVGHLEEGMTREQVLEGFSRSEEFKKIMAGYGLYEGGTK